MDTVWSKEMSFIGRQKIRRKSNQLILNVQSGNPSYKEAETEGQQLWVSPGNLVRLCVKNWKDKIRTGYISLIKCLPNIHKAVSSFWAHRGVSESKSQAIQSGTSVILQTVNYYRIYYFLQLQVHWFLQLWFMYIQRTIASVGCTL